MRATSIADTPETGYRIGTARWPGRNRKYCRNCRQLSLPGIISVSCGQKGDNLTTHQNFPSFFVDRWNLGVIQRVLPNQRVEIRDYGWWDRGSCRVGLG